MKTLKRKHINMESSEIRKHLREGDGWHRTIQWGFSDRSYWFVQWYKKNKDGSITWEESENAGYPG